MSREVEGIVSGVEGLLGAFVMAGVVGASQGRARAAERQAHEARCNAAARAAEGDVYAASAAQLRERLADAEDDIAAISEERDRLRADLNAVCAYLSDLRRSGRIAA